MLVPENQSPTVAVLLPCYNEEVTIGKVVRDFKASLPQADIYVYDNNSTDRTADIAASEGAIVRKEPRQGKGNVIRAMFEDIDADVYVMADGDDTYPADAAPALVDKVLGSARKVAHFGSWPDNARILAHFRIPALT
jgi:glycosyltransferase involved in cell wall biosynthesis